MIPINEYKSEYDWFLSHEERIYKIPASSKIGTIYTSSRPCYPMNNCSMLEVLPYIGKLKKNHIRNVFVLLNDNDLKDYYNFDLLKLYQSKGLKVNHFPIPDFGVPSNIKYFDMMINTFIRENGNSLIHCSAGLGRTGLFVVAILIKLGIDLDIAIKYARRYNPSFVESSIQMKFLKEYEEYTRS